MPDRRPAPSTRATLLATALGLVLLYVLLRFLFPFVLALIVGGAVYYIFAPAVSRLEGRGIPRVAAAVVVSLLILTGLWFATTTLVPRLYTELVDLAADIPRWADSAEEWLVGQGVAGDEAESRFAGAFDALLERTGELGVGAAEAAVNTVIGLIESVFAVVFGLVIGLYLLVGGPAVARAAPRWFPPAQRGRWVRLGREASAVLSGYLRARLIASLFIGTAYGVSFWLIGLPDPLLLGVVGGVLNLVPIIGPIVAAVPALVVAAFQGWTVVLLVLVVMVVAQQIESTLIDPHLEGRFVQLSPTVVVIVVAFGSALAGIAGLLLAVPIAALAKVALETFYLESWEEPPDGKPRVALKPGSPARRTAAAGNR